MFLVINEERMNDTPELLGDDLITTSPVYLLDHILADFIVWGRIITTMLWGSWPGNNLQHTVSLVELQEKQDSAA